MVTYAHPQFSFSFRSGGGGGLMDPPRFRYHSTHQALCFLKYATLSLLYKTGRLYISYDVI